MLKLLNPLAHGVLDYGLALTFLLAPALFAFTQASATLSYVIGFAYFGASLVTNYPLGAIRLLSFPAHGAIEAVMAASWIAMPWLFGFAGNAAARNFFVVAGIVLLVVVAITDYRGLETRAAYRGAERRQPGLDRRRRYVAVARDRRLGDRRGNYAAA
jgi:hypothetical protein